MSESDVSILIPSYRRPDMTRRAVLSALASGAGEIIVSDDASNDGTVETLRQISPDPRLQIVVQPVNLGLWPNHLALLRMASRPWIKFIQNDDWIEPGGLAAMVAQIGPQTSLVAAMSCYQDADTGKRRAPRILSKPRRFTSDQYLQRMAITGNEPGTPSDALWRRDALDHSNEAWRTELSVDLICNVLAASRGEVVLIPAGPVVTLDHVGRDTHVQRFSLFVQRTLNTMRYLLASGDARIRRTTRILACREGIGVVRVTIGQLRRGHWVYRGFFRDLAGIFAAGMSATILRDLSTIYRSTRWKYFSIDKGSGRVDLSGVCLAGVCLDTDRPIRHVAAYDSDSSGAAPAGEVLT